MLKYTIKIQGKPVEVSKEVYEYLTKSDNHIKYIEKTRGIVKKCAVRKYPKSWIGRSQAAW